MFEVVIVGGGAAGLSAALVLGRCRRRVRVYDTGTPRNAAASAIHGFLTRDGTPPTAFLKAARAELAAYGMRPVQAAVHGIEAMADHFDVLVDGDRVATSMILLATGVRDHVPDLPGVAECYGRSVHHCPYCDGWENRDRRIVVLGKGQAVTGLALSLLTWSRHVTVVTNGPGRLPPDSRARLARQGIAVRQERVLRLDHEGGAARALILSSHPGAAPGEGTSGERLTCDALFFTGGQSPQARFARDLGCEFTRKGTVRTDRLGATCVPGVYVAGDASHDVQFVVVAAAEGAKAAVAINKALQVREGLGVGASTRAEGDAHSVDEATETL